MIPRTITAQTIASRESWSSIMEAIKKYWDMPAFCNFGAETLTYGDVATGIEKYHILFKECGIKKDEKIKHMIEQYAKDGYRGRRFALREHCSLPPRHTPLPEL